MSKKKKKNSQKMALKKKAKARERRIRTLTLWTVIILILVGGLYFLTSVLSDQQAKPVDEKIFAYERQPVIGNPDAPVRIVEFGDYKCPVCKRFTEEIFPQLKRDFLDTGKAGMYFIDKPFIGEDSVTASMAAEAVHRQKPEAFWTFYKVVYAHQGLETDQWATVPFLVELAKKEVPDIDHARMERELNDQVYRKEVEADRKIAAELGVDSVPTLFINGKRVDQDTVFDYPSLKKQIEEELKGSR
ncbi:protein-disulfide isomerase [Planifilum fimeticola]|jgi:protein-disulfide isomerase|uniref:Protein-disulfide isomerase n=1 Tax=Planifilum fimeticola TaxID=201975 RepID=A0A2T0LHQ5_9BACL|nr:DsbA family protein [Planifilum fimeticola]PRX41886.1 protein-disulfide isomerase [Planifilum fimeticola]